MTLRDTNTTTTDKSRARLGRNRYWDSSARYNERILINETSANASSNKLHSGPLYQVAYFEPTCSPNHSLPHHVFRGAKEAKVATVVSRKENVDGQNHLNILTHGQKRYAFRIARYCKDAPIKVSNEEVNQIKI